MAALLGSVDLEIQGAIARLPRDARAMEVLYHHFQVAAMRVAEGIINDHELAEDAVQESFWKAYKQIQTFDETKGGFRSWFLTIVANTTLDYVRKRRPVNLNEQPLSVDEVESLLVERDLDAQLIAAETREEIHELLDGLPPNLRAVLILRYYAGLDYHQIAAHQNIPDGTVKSRLNTAKQVFRRAIEVRVGRRDDDLSSNPLSVLAAAQGHFRGKARGK